MRNLCGKSLKLVKNDRKLKHEDLLYYNNIDIRYKKWKIGVLKSEREKIDSMVRKRKEVGGLCQYKDKRRIT